MKGITIQQVPQILMIVMLIGIFLGATYITLEAFQGSQYAITTATNESRTLTVNAYNSFTNPYLTSTSAVSRVGNNTITLGAGNYSVVNTGYHTYQLNFTASTGITTGTYNVTYNYNADTKATTGIGYVVSMTEQLASNLPTVGIMLFVGILITVVFWMVASGRIGKGKGGA